MVKILTNVLFLADGARHWPRDVALIVICVLVCAYLFAALLWPEKF